MTRNIHLFWHDGILPDQVKPMYASWANKNPKWRVFLWTEDLAYNIIVEQYPEYKILFDRCIYKIQQWDLMRYYLVNILGGLYVDIDMECLECIDEIIDSPVTLYREDKQYSSKFKFPFMLHHNFMYADPDTSLFNKIIKNLPKYHEGKGRFGMENCLAGDYIGYTTGPFMMTQEYLTCKDRDEITILDNKTFKKHVKHYTMTLWKDPLTAA